MNEQGQRQPWERQPNEPAAAFASFTAYRDAGPRRSLTVVYRRQTGKRWARGSSGRWNKWASDWQWRVRAEAWDSWMGAQFAASIQEHIHQEAGRLAREQAEQRQRELRLGKALLERVSTMLSFPLTRVTREEKDGTTRVIVEPTNWSLGDAVKMVEVGCRLRRHALDLPSSERELREANEQAQQRVLEHDARSMLRTVGLEATDQNVRELFDTVDNILMGRETLPDR